PRTIDSIDAGRRVSVYAADGNVIQTRDGRGVTAVRTYDAAGRISRVLARDGPGAPLTTREAVVYGDGGDAAQPAAARAAARAQYSLGRVTRHYDEAGLVISEYDFAGRAVAG